MGELILCRSPIARTPYYIEEKALNIYSIEELAWYIENNVFLLNQNFMSKELADWIRDEQGDRKLAGELSELLAENVPLHIFCGHILEASGYCTPEETRSTTEKIANLENRSEAECRKIRADHLLHAGQISEASFEYEKLLEEKDALKIDGRTEGLILHNLGVCFGRLFLFREAEKCFAEAYERTREHLSLSCLLDAARLAGDEGHYRELLKKYLVPPEACGELESAYDAARQAATAGVSSKETPAKAAEEIRNAYRSENRL